MAPYPAFNLPGGTSPSLSGQEMLREFGQQHHETGMNPELDRHVLDCGRAKVTVSANDLVDQYGDEVPRCVTVSGCRFGH